MSSKKKSRPLFEVPVEIGSGQDSGWVYRSDAPDDTPEKEGPVPRASSELDVGAESAQVLAMAFATLAHTFSLAVRISVLPMAIGMRALRSLIRSDEDR